MKQSLEVWILLAILATPAMARPAHANPPAPGPHLWCSEVDAWPKQEEVAVLDLALRGGPILWFSDDEPLLRRNATSAMGPKASAPWPLPCDAPAVRPVVYYHLAQILLRKDATDDDLGKISAGTLVPRAIDRARIDYYFYYPQDTGFAPHVHDFESASVDLHFTAVGDTGRCALVNRIVGWGHGNELLANILQVKPGIRHRYGASDTLLPPTILVEEGKHASCPDRNGDGFYTPGVDTNVRVPDGWGVRDAFGAGGVIAAKYSPAMTKSRLRPTQFYMVDASREATVGYERFRIGPDLPPNDPLYLEYERSASLNGHLPFPVAPLARYELRDILPFRGCMAPAPGRRRRPPGPVKWEDESKIFGARCLDNTDSKCDYLNLWRVTTALKPVQMTRYRLKYNYGPFWPLQPIRTVFVAGTYVGGGYGAAAGLYLPYGLPIVAGWFNGRFGVVRDGEHWRKSVDVLFTPSVTRLATWYGGVGLDLDGARSVEDAAAGNFERRFALEGGLQGRFSAISVRLGTRYYLGRGSLTDPRITVELGVGPWPKYARVH